MLTLLLLDHTPDAEREIVSLLGEQDCQNFEILSAPSYARLDDILNDARGDYLWILPPYHTPAQTQSIKKILGLLNLHAPDLIAGHFVYADGLKKKFHRRRLPKKFLNVPLSSFIWSINFLKTLDEEIICDDLKAAAYSSVRFILKANFPVSIVPEPLTNFAPLFANAHADIHKQFIVLFKNFARDERLII